MSNGLGMSSTVLSFSTASLAAAFGPGASIIHGHSTWSLSDSPGMT